MNRPKSPFFALLIIDMVNDFDFRHGNMLLEHYEAYHRSDFEIKKANARKGFSNHLYQ